MHDVKHKKVPDSSIFLNVVLCALAALVLAWILVLCQFGIDITDEGMHLTSMANPTTYQSVTQFGLIYSPLYKLYAGDVVLLRVTNLLLLIIAGFYFIYALLASLKMQLSQYGAGWWCLVFPLSLTSLVFLNVWQPTPSYNTLNLSGLLIVAASVIRIYTAPQNANISNWVILGIAAAIVFLAKASTAVIVALATMSFMLATRSLRTSGVMFASAAALVTLLGVAIIMDGSVTGFIERISTGLSGGKLASEGVNVAHMLWHGQLNPGWQVVAHLCTLSLILLLVLLAFESGHASARVFAVVLIGLSLLFCLLVLSGLIANTLQELKATKRLFFAFSIPLSVTLFACVVRFSQNKQADLGKQLFLCVFLVGMAYSFAIGTNSSYYYVGLKASIFLIGASLALLPENDSMRTSQTRLGVIGFFSTCMVLLLIHAAVQKPHRQPAGSITANTVKTSQAEFGSRLKLQLGSEQYLSALFQLAYRNGFEPDTPMLDLTGASPGSLYALKAKGVGSPWLIGGYANSFARASHAISQADKAELERAWLLLELEGHRSHDLALLSLFDKNLQDDYRLIGRVTIPQGLGGRKSDKIQMLYQPIRVSSSYE